MGHLSFRRDGARQLEMIGPKMPGATRNPSPHSPAKAPHAVVPSWSETPLLKMLDAARLAGCSRARIYGLAKEGHLSLVKLAGRTLVKTESLARFIDSAQPYVPDGSGARGSALNRQRDRAAVSAIAA